jgi:hypothetical protein
MRQEIVHSLLASLLLIQSVLPSALAQAGERQTANDSLTAEEILVARSPYTQHEDVPRGSVDGQTRSEPAQRRPVILVPPQIQYPGAGAHSGVWRQPRNARHAAIGALIGFGLGAAIGAKVNKDQHTQARIGAPILFGGFGALIGAVIGGSHP